MEQLESVIVRLSKLLQEQEHQLDRYGLLGQYFELGGYISKIELMCEGSCIPGEIWLYLEDEIFDSLLRFVHRDVSRDKRGFCNTEAYEEYRLGIEGLQARVKVLLDRA